jgi:rhodanese-related sulfurtransferase
MRKTDWLQFWGGQRIKMFGGSYVSIVDIRNAASFYQGHVPFALNIPSDLFKSNLDAEERLAGIPRYVELVCFSDDPGEAAVNYFILRLMGFADVKVLVN